MRTKLPFTIDNLAALCSVKLIVNPLTTDDKVVIMAPRKSMMMHSVDDKAISVWDLATGIISGDCSLEDADEIIMSPARFQQIQDKVYEMNHRMEQNPYLSTPIEPRNTF